jgi:hypothetical protein
VAKLLVDDYGANLQAVDPGFGMAAIHISAENGQLGSVRVIRPEWTLNRH